jgi:hypothetical protein
MTSRFTDARTGIHVLDLTEQEGEQLGSKGGRKQAPHGRPQRQLAVYVGSPRKEAAPAPPHAPRNRQAEALQAEAHCRARKSG